MATNQLPMAQFARLAGITPAAFRRWVANKDSTTARQRLCALARVLGISEDDALREAVRDGASGPATAEERLTLVGRANIRFAAERARSPEASAKGAATRRGRKQAPAHTEAIRRAWLGNPAAETAKARLVSWHKSLDGKIVQLLWPLIKRSPAPSKEQVAEHASRMAPRLGTSPEMVLRAWRPHLQKRGLVAKGRPPAKRYVAVAKLRTDWPRRANGVLKTGFVKAAWEVAEREEGRRIDLAAFEKWLYRQVWTD